VGARHVEHARVEIDAHDMREMVKPLCRDTGDNPRPTRRIYDPVTGMECHVRKHPFGQGSAKRVHRLAFIQLGCVPF
jgi:hypothetical protein